MHDLDRTQSEYPAEFDEFQPEEFEYDFEGEYEYDGEAEAGGPFNESDEMALAAELLGVSDEHELDQFIGKLFKKVSRGVRGIASKVAKPLGGMLKGIARKALPFVGGALGSMIPIPGVGTALGTAAGTAASRLFELELEGLSPEDQEYEVARRFVRLAGAAAQKAGIVPPGFDPRAAAKTALSAAAKQYAPGLFSLLGETGSMPGATGTTGGAPAAGGRMGMGQRAPRSGRWVRRGRNIIILGA
jgi:uncharacterized protein (DUF697 family)